MVKQIIKEEKIQSKLLEKSIEVSKGNIKIIVKIGNEGQLTIKSALNGYNKDTFQFFNSKKHIVKIIGELLIEASNLVK